MPERVQDWWARRQFSRGRAVPYEVGTYRDAWAPYPVLIRQYHPDLNAGITLTQIPPAADVLLLWQCDTGHLFVATPTEQRSRPTRERRRSVWCPECAALANPPRVRMPDTGAFVMQDPAAGALGPQDSTAGAAPAAAAVGAPAAGTTAPRAAQRSASGRARASRRARGVCAETPDLPVGEPFLSACAPVPASAVEARLRADLFARLAVTEGLNAVRVARPFFDHVEVWPDILLPELRVAIEYDSTGRHGLEHVGKREDADRRKDRALRAAHWEVVRLRTGRLEKLGPHDLQLAAWNGTALSRLLDVLREVRGPLMIDAYLR
ncbi:zinc-ribbon domain-containing protein [Microbacter sp. GSS18]|nr:zinc-ribbon domain-containing protein [Microbacter sp. GSS18]